MFNLPDKKLATTQDSQPGTAELRRKAILSVLVATFGCYQLDCPQTDCLLKLYTPMLGKSGRTVSREFYLEKSVYVGVTSYG